MTKPGQEAFTVGEGKAISETKAALKVKMDDDRALWVPKSVIHDDSEVYEVGGEGTLVVFQWFADKEGWS